jgi:hypothetical protein
MNNNEHDENNHNINEASNYIQRIIRANNEQYRIFQREYSNISYNEMINKYAIYFIKIIFMELILIFFMYLKNENHFFDSTSLNNAQQMESPLPTEPSVQNEDVEIINNNNQDTRNFMLPNHTLNYLPIFNSWIQTNISYEQRTEEIIQTATETNLYNSSINSMYTDCSISYEPFIEGESICRIIHCGHMFKEQSIRSWFERSLVCPVCRYNIQEYTVFPNDNDSYSDLPELINASYLDDDDVMSNFVNEIDPHFQNDR